jgi:hypothetical protein
MIACFQVSGSMINVPEVKASKWCNKSKCSLLIGDNPGPGLGVISWAPFWAGGLKVTFREVDFRDAVQVRTHSCLRLTQFRHGCSSSHCGTCYWNPFAKWLRSDHTFTLRALQPAHPNLDFVWALRLRASCPSGPTPDKKTVLGGALCCKVKQPKWRDWGLWVSMLQSDKKRDEDELLRNPFCVKNCG